MRQIIDMPLALMRITEVDWDISWGGQSAGADGGGGDQFVMNTFPRFVSPLKLRFEREAVGAWRAFRSRIQGRRNALRMRMLDPALMPVGTPEVFGGLRAWMAGDYVEPRPQVRCVTAVVPGAVAVTVDESNAPNPVQVGQYLSFGDWPFLVQGRSGAGAAVVLEVTMMRVAIPANGMIDTIARGLFTMTDESQGALPYDRNLRVRPNLQLTEWITRL